MLKGQDIICISSIDWDFIWQGHQEIMSMLAKNGNNVIFIENTGVRVPGIRDFSRIKSRIRNWFAGIKGIRKESENLYIFSPLVLPFPYSRIARWVNRYLMLSVLKKWMKVMNFSNPVIWTFLPTPLSMDVADRTIKKLLVYYCIDNFSFSSVAARKIKRSEEKLLRKADLVFVTSKELYNYCSGYNDKVYIFPFAVNFAEFEKVRESDAPMPLELKDIRHPVVGYVGGVHKWVDQGLIKETARNNPQYSFVFVGPIQTDVSMLLSLKNVHFLGKKKHQEIPLFVKSFDAGIIPYLITDYTNNVYPTKLNEYLALGKPVVSTSLPEVIAFNKPNGGVVYISGDGEEFGKHIAIAVNEKSAVLRNKRIDAARNNNWENRIEKMSALVESEIKSKRLDREARWRENLLVFYRRAKSRVLSLGLILGVLYLLLFKTPFIWLMASPLRIDGAPQKADVIVVLGGGVGETGSPGTDTIERARYAAKIHNEGYANNIIFSSGYTYVYNDAENMKLFAISMGVPDRNIILEQRSNSAYENVIFSKEILDRNKWDSVLLISSPYNMLRISLVFNKWASNIKVSYLPVEKSKFFDKENGIRLEQIKSIIHEYLGIIYYWFKGYV